MIVHRFLSPETAACFDGVTTDQVRADLAEVETTGWWTGRPIWVQRLDAMHAEHSFSHRVHAGIAADCALRFIADRERAEIADRLRSIDWANDDLTWGEVQAIADQLDPKD